jgi:hypothetical protein
LSFGLYRETHATFEEYMAERWGWTRRHGYEYIEASRVAENVRSTSHSSPSLTQAQLLARLAPEQQREVAETTDFKTTTVKALRAAKTAGVAENGKLTSHMQS